MSKKNLCTMVFLLSIIANCSAQKNSLLIGIHSGVGIVSVRGNTILDQFHSPDLRFTIGGMLKYKLKKGFYLETQINYEQKGSAIKRQELTDELGNSLGYGSSTNKINYLTLPFLIGKDFGNKLKFNLKAGFFGGLLTSQKNIDRIDNGSSFTSSDKNKFKKTDFGFSSGIGMSLPINKKLIGSFQIINNIGLSNISAVTVIDNGSIKTNSFNALVGLAYLL